MSTSTTAAHHILQFECMISLETMRYPVITNTGHSMELQSLLRHIATGNTLCPVTKNKIVSYTPNWTLKKIIDSYISTHPELEQERTRDYIPENYGNAIIYLGDQNAQIAIPVPRASQYAAIEVPIDDEFPLNNADRDNNSPERPVEMPANERAETQTLGLGEYYAMCTLLIGNVYLLKLALPYAIKGLGEVAKGALSLSASAATQSLNAAGSMSLAGGNMLLEASRFTLFDIVPEVASKSLSLSAKGAELGLYLAGATGTALFETSKFTLLKLLPTVLEKSFNTSYYGLYYGLAVSKFIIENNLKLSLFCINHGLNVSKLLLDTLMTFVLVQLINGLSLIGVIDTCEHLSLTGISQQARVLHSIAGIALLTICITKPQLVEQTLNGIGEGMQRYKDNLERQVGRVKDNADSLLDSVMSLTQRR